MLLEEHIKVQLKERVVTSEIYQGKAGEIG